MTGLLSRCRWNLLAGVAVLIVYVSVLAVMPTHVFWSPDEGGKFLELHSVHWHGGLTYTVPYRGQRIDPELKFYPRVSTSVNNAFPYPAVSATGTLRFNWPIWFPVLSGFMLRTFGMTGLYIVPLLSAWLIALVSGRIAQSLHPRFGPWSILLVGLATPICFYGQVFWEHTLVTLLALLATAILLAARPGSLPALLAMTPLLLLAMMLRIEMVAFAAAAVLTWGIAGWVARQWRVFPPATVPAPVTGRSRRLAPWVWYLFLGCIVAGALVVFARTTPPRQLRFITTLPVRLGTTLRALPHLPRSVVSLFVSTGRSEGPAVNPVWVTLAAVAVVLCFVAPFVPSVLVEAALLLPALVVVLAFSGAVAYLNQRYRALHGIFPVAPFTVLWLYGLPQAWRRRDSGVLTLAVLAALYLSFGCAAIFVFYVDAAGGLSTGLEWGQRYLLTLYPLLAILSGLALSMYRESSRPSWLRTSVTVLVAAMMLIGVQQEVRGLAMLRSSRNELAAYDSVLRNGDPIVTDVWWLPTALAPLYLAHDFYYVQTRAELAEWVRLGTAHAIARFNFVSLTQPTDGELAADLARPNPQGSRQVWGLYVTKFDLVGVGGTPPLP